MNSPKGLLAEVLIEYVCIETLGNKIMSFLNQVTKYSYFLHITLFFLTYLSSPNPHYDLQSFGQFDIIEHLSDFYRFRIDTGISIGKIFG